MKFIKILFLLLFAVQTSFSQIISGVLRGRLTDKISKKPIINATILLQNDKNSFSTFSDSTGQYIFENIALGRYTISASLIGYIGFKQEDIQIISTKESVLEIELEQTIQQLNEVEVKTKYAPLQNLSERTFANEHAQRLAGTYFDPARMATVVPGVVTSQDFGNDVVIRGNSPSGVLWKIEGADVLNPNHLTNGSTPNERISPSGGGVSMLSGQMVQNTKFMLGAYPAGYGNAMAGVFDVRFRKGNNKKREYTAQASLIGLEFAAEGPFSKKSKASYLINYRYSTLGLMALAGLDFGGQTFGFQDLSFNISLPTKKLGHFTLFGLAGTSENNFLIKDSTEKWKQDASERLMFTFQSSMMATGATHSVALSPKITLKNIISYSAQSANNESKFYNTKSTYITRFTDQYAASLIYFTSFVQAKLGLRNNFEAGIQYRLNGVILNAYSSKNLYNNSFEIYKIKQNNNLVQLYAKNRYTLATNADLEAGVQVSYLANNGALAIDPRLSFRYAPLLKHSFNISYAIVSQMQPLATYYVPNQRGELPNANLGFTRAHHFVLGHNYLINETYKLRTEVYYQYLFNVPVSKRDSAFSMLNYLQGFALDTALTNAGTGQNMGVDISLERTFYNGLYFMVGGSIYDSKYKALDGVMRNSLFNGNAMAHVAIGKEWSWDTKKQKNKVIGINLRLFTNGGFRSTPIIANTSSITGLAVYDSKNTNSNQIKNYFRGDIRVYYRINGPRSSQILAIDIWNVTNYDNVAVMYFDPVANEIRTKSALPFYPNISYRVEF
ncbi:MAG: TonB-dependent receptor [Bacteroidota bacterium]|nr:TonB-dependent receptor [Bacteroidota bacterium]